MANAAARGAAKKRLRARENAGHGIVIFSGDGIELVIMTARAGNGNRHEGAGGHVELLVDKVHFELLRVAVVERLGAHGEEAGGNATGIGGLARQQVAGDLFLDKLVERLVRIECVDHVIAIAPRVREGGVAFHAIAFGIAGHVQPVAAPAFAKV